MKTGLLSGFLSFHAEPCQPDTDSSGCLQFGKIVQKTGFDVSFKVRLSHGLAQYQVAWGKPQGLMSPKHYNCALLLHCSCQRCMRQFLQLLTLAGVQDFKIQNVVGSADVKFPVRLEGLSFAHSLFCSVSTSPRPKYALC